MYLFIYLFIYFLGEGHNWPLWIASVIIIFLKVTFVNSYSVRKSEPHILLDFNKDTAYLKTHFKCF